jgi:3-hydroxyisobutyrate dehydrogenase-like beta-hydroxyacid dehydrogenase
VEETYKKITSLNIEGKTFCESSTIHPKTTKETESAVVAKGAKFVAGMTDFSLIQVPFSERPQQQ